jgi:hypothetical protein
MREIGGETMDDIGREKKKGLGRWYLKDVLFKRRLLKETYHTPGFGFAAQLFAVMSKFILAKLGPVEGEALIKEAVGYFGRERGKRIASVVKSLGKPLSFKNWLIYTDIDGSNFEARPSIDNHDLLAEVHRCTFMAAADKWGLKEYAALYCKYADHAILEGYNSDIKLELKSRHETGKDYCLFRYIMKEGNK